MSSVTVALDQLVREAAWLRRLAGSLVADGAAADDLVQDTMLVAAAHAPSDGRPIGPWLARVLRNLVRMRARSAGRRAGRERAAHDATAAPPNPEALVSQLELQRRLAGLVLELSPSLRDVVLLHYFEGLASPEIGRRLALSDGTVRWRLKQALDELRDRLEAREPNRAWVPALAGFAGLPVHARSPLVARAGRTSVAALACGALAVVGALALALVAAPWRGDEPLAGVGRAQAPEAARGVAATAVARAGEPAVPAVGKSLAELDAIADDIEEVRLEGRVIDDAGSAVAGAEVAARGLTGLAVTRSGPDGGFVFPSISADPFARPMLFARTADAASLVWTSSGPGPWVLVLSRLPLTVFAVSDAATGAPIAGATVTVTSYGRPTPLRLVADADGKARCRCAEEIGMKLAVSAAGYVPLDYPMFFERGSGATPSEHSLRLRRGIPIRGRVVDAQGHGVARAELAWVGQGSRARTQADEQGAFATAVLAEGPVVAEVLTPGLVVAGSAREIVVRAEGVSDALVRVEPILPASGVVVDTTGAPVEGARVRFLGSYGGPAITDARGQFALLPTWRPSTQRNELWGLFVDKGELASRVVPVVFGAGRAQVGLTIEVERAGVTGRVVDGSGAPVAGADVRRQSCCEGDREAPDLHVTSDAAGRFAMPTPRGVFVLAARRSRQQAFDEDDEQPVYSGERDVQLVAP